MYKLSSAAGFVGISDNTIDFNDLTEYNKYFVASAEMNPNKPFSNWGYLTNDYFDNTRILQTFISDEGHKFYLRTKYNDTWKNWVCIYPDYSNRLFNTNGYIIFNNGLTLQWGMYSINNASFNILNKITPVIQFSSYVKHWTNCYSPAWDTVTTIDWNTSQIAVRPIERAKEVIDRMKLDSFEWDLTTCKFYLYILQI